MATFVIMTLNDELDPVFSADVPGGTGLSLREALALANADDTTQDRIVFASAGTIHLAGALDDLQVSGTVIIDGDIDGDGVGDITIDANSAAGLEDADSRVLIVLSGSVTLNGLTLSGGKTSGSGGAIAVNSGAALALTNAKLAGNKADDQGGGLFNAGIAVLTDTTVLANSAGDGGGIANAGELTATDTEVSRNAAVGAGGGVMSTGEMTLLDVTISGNEAQTGGGVANEGVATLVQSTVQGVRRQMFPSRSYLGNRSQPSCVRFFTTSFMASKAAPTRGTTRSLPRVLSLRAE